MRNTNPCLIHKVLAGIVVLLFGTTVLAETGRSVDTLGSADLMQISYEAKAQNKSLMIIYTREDCEKCQRFIKDIEHNTQLSSAMAQYKVYHVNKNKSFDVICPSGMELADNEFYAMKGIKGPLSVVFHSERGDVVHVHNDRPQTINMSALLEYVGAQHYADGTRFKDWLALQYSAL